MDEASPPQEHPSSKPEAWDGENRQRMMKTRKGEKPTLKS